MRRSERGSVISDCLVSMCIKGPCKGGSIFLCIGINSADLNVFEKFRKNWKKSGDMVKCNGVSENLTF